MRIANILVPALLMIIACNSPDIPREVIIEGNVKNIPDGKIYLTDAHRWRVPLDSTECKNGHFIFRIKNDSTFVPYKASIYYPDSTKPYKTASIFFRNHMRGDDSMRNSTNAFYLEQGYTRIEGDNNAKPALRVFSGKETDLMYKFHSGFGWIGNADSSNRISRIKYVKSEVRKHPFSYFLLQEIYNAKEQYSEKEIAEIFSGFNSNVRKSPAGDKIRAYLQNRTDPNTPYPNLSLLNSHNQKGNIIDHASNLNMIVFWASWCGPCRKEIPMLQEIHNQYKNKGLNMVSISIDEDKDRWEEALRQEKMSWTQYLVEKDKIDLVSQQFNFSAIPLVVFTNKEGMEIRKFIGYDREQKKNYEAVINNYIH